MAHHQNHFEICGSPPTKKRNDTILDDKINLHDFRRHKINLHDFTLTQMHFIHVDRQSVTKFHYAICSYPHSHTTPITTQVRGMSYRKEYSSTGANSH